MEGAKRIYLDGKPTAALTREPAVAADSFGATRYEESEDRVNLIGCPAVRVGKDGTILLPSSNSRIPGSGRQSSRQGSNPNRGARRPESGQAGSG